MTPALTSHIRNSGHHRPPHGIGRPAAAADTLPVDFDPTEEQRAYYDSVVRFAGRELGGEGAPGPAPFATAWRRCAEFGIQGLAVPAAYGGSEAGALTIILAMEALGLGCRDNGLLFSINAQMWACQHPLARLGTEEQRRRYLPGLCAGSIVAAHALTEPGSGSDAFALATTASPRGDGYVLNGTKTFVTNAPVADLFLVFATIDRSRGFGGVCAFLVERDDAGLSVGAPARKMGLDSSPMGDVVLHDCLVPSARMLGAPGGGIGVFNAAMERERSFILASTLGTMQRDLDRCVGHARERRQFDQPIGRFQAVSHRIVDMRLRLDTARLLLYRLGWLADQGRPIGLQSALVKLHLSECFLQSSLDAVQIHGGYGYLSECQLEQDVRDAVAGRIYSGTSEVLRNLAARHMGL